MNVSVEQPPPVGDGHDASEVDCRSSDAWHHTVGLLDTPGSSGDPQSRG